LYRLLETTCASGDERLFSSSFPLKERGRTHVATVARVSLSASSVQGGEPSTRRSRGRKKLERRKRRGNQSTSSPTSLSSVRERGYLPFLRRNRQTLVVPPPSSSQVVEDQKSIDELERKVVVNPGTLSSLPALQRYGRSAYNSMYDVTSLFENESREEGERRD
jgi:hypothetical protein